MVKVVINPQKYRYERKFVVLELTKHEIESIVRLHPAMFSEIYHERFVNNLYFDSYDTRFYFDTVNGLKNRLKVRIRWYGDLFGTIKKPVLEFKIKDNSVSRKEQFSLMPFTLNNHFQFKQIVELMKKSNISDIVKERLSTLEFSLLNRYKRKYFQSADHRYRITIDTELEIYQIMASNNTYIDKYVDYETTIVELKYNLESDDEARRITNYFPFRMTKSSKYATGIERICIW